MMKQLTALLVVASAVGCGEKSSASVDSIVAYSRENNSGTYAYFKEHVLNNEDFAADIQTLPGTAAVINAVSKDRGSIGYGGIGYVKGVRALKVKKDAASASVEPSLDNVVKGTYPISRSLYFYTAGRPEGAARHFVAWALSPPGQKICSEVGYYPLPDKQQGADAGAAPAGKATITMKGSDTMVILGQRWAEHYMKSNPEITIQITGGGSGTGIAALINGATNICMSSRPMKQTEKDKVKEKYGKEAVEFSVALDALAVFVHESSMLQDISIPELKSIYTGKTKLWSALGKP
jgi:ABC-type phosphate transport system substrate-binding protein